MQSYNVLLTSISAVESDPPKRHFSVKDGSGCSYFDALLDAEAGIKTVLSRHEIDEVIVIGGAGSNDEPFSTYGLLQSRIAQFADGAAGRQEDEDESLPEDAQDKLAAFIRGYGEGSLFNELSQDKQLYERFWKELFEACPELCDDQSRCRKWVKRYLYDELEPSLKLEILPANKGVRLSFVPEAEFEDGRQWVDNMMSMEKSITEDKENINLYVTLNSDDAADTFIVMNMLDILISMPESGVRLKKIFTVRSPQRSMTGIVRDDTDGFGVTELFHAIRAFLNYGRADMIADIWKKSGESNESIEDMVKAMRDVDIGLSMCNITEMERGILRLRELFRGEKFWRESGYYGMMFSLIAESIREDYGALMEGDGDINFIEMVKWAYRHQFYQQTLTLIESRTPENLVKTGIFYYCDDEEHMDDVLRLFAQQRLALRPYEYYKMDYIDHYFIKSYDRSRTRSRGGKGKNPQRVYAILRTESVDNRDPSLITGFTACDDLKTLQDVLFAYYNVGYIRNKISHADAGAMERKNMQACDGNESSALTWMTDSIDLFIESYEKAVNEVQGKSPNVVIITGDDVRTAAERMRNKRG